MESHYKDSLSTAVVKMLIQCGFENSSKRAIDELVGIAIGYINRLSAKITDLTNECDLSEPDLLLGLGALQFHDENLDELLLFLQNYNEIFPKQPDVYYGPVIRSENYSIKDKNKIVPKEFVDWVPPLDNSLSTIGYKLDNGEVLEDATFDKKTLLNYQLFPKSLVKEKSLSADAINPSSFNSDGITSNITLTDHVKYGSYCGYELPQEALPTKYEIPTVDYDSSRSVIIVNGKNGKLPDPFISDMEEQDLMRHKSTFNNVQERKLKFPGKQYFNGYNQMLKHINGPINSSNNSCGEVNNTSLNDTNTEQENVSVKNEDINCRESSLHSIDRFASPVLGEHDLNQQKVSIPIATITNASTASVQGGTSDEVWNAALQARIEPIAPSFTSLKSESKSISFPQSHQSIYQSDTQSVTNNSQYNSPRKRSRKHPGSSLSNSRAKKKRRVEDNNIPSNDIYQNDSTNDVPYSNINEDRKPDFSYLDGYKMPSHTSMSPIDYSRVPHDDLNNPSLYNPNMITYHNTVVSPEHISHNTESVSTKPTKLSTKTKKKTYRKSHFNKRKRKPLLTSSSTTFHLNSTNNNNNNRKIGYVDVGEIYGDYDDEVSNNNNKNNNHLHVIHPDNKNFPEKYPSRDSIYLSPNGDSPENINPMSINDSDSDQTEPMLDNNYITNTPDKKNSSIFHLMINNNDDAINNNYDINNSVLHNIHNPAALVSSSSLSAAANLDATANEDFSLTQNRISRRRYSQKHPLDSSTLINSHYISHDNHNIDVADSPNIRSSSHNYYSSRKSSSSRKAQSDYYQHPALPAASSTTSGIVGTSSHHNNVCNSAYSAASYQTTHTDTVISDDSNTSGMRLKIKLKKSSTSDPTALQLDADSARHMSRSSSIRRIYADNDDDEDEGPTNTNANYNPANDDCASISERLEMMREQSHSPDESYVKYHVGLSTPGSSASSINYHQAPKHHNKHKPPSSSNHRPRHHHHRQQQQQHRTTSQDYHSNSSQFTDDNHIARPSATSSSQHNNNNQYTTSPKLHCDNNNDSTNRSPQIHNIYNSLYSPDQSSYNNSHRFHPVEQIRRDNHDKNNQMEHSPLIFKTTKSKKKKRSKSSGGRKSKSHKQVKAISNDTVEPCKSSSIAHNKTFVSVSDVFDDDDDDDEDNNNCEVALRHQNTNIINNHTRHNNHHNLNSSERMSNSPAYYSSSTTPQRLALKICRTPTIASTPTVITKHSSHKSSSHKSKQHHSTTAQSFDQYTRQPTTNYHSTSGNISPAGSYYQQYHHAPYATTGNHSIVAPDKPAAPSINDSTICSTVQSVLPATSTVNLANFNYCCKPGEANYTSADGTVVYICPICNLEDNGSLMVCCDSCQDWYHGLCLGITSIAEDVEWYCPRCVERKTKKQHKHNKHKQQPSQNHKYHQKSSAYNSNIKIKSSTTNKKQTKSSSSSRKK